MSNTTLHWNLRTVMHHMRDGGRLAVYLCYLLHANIRNRAWPSIELLMKETGWARASVVEAKQWLVEHRAIEKVAIDKRVGEETKLHQRCDVMQITGGLIIDGTATHILYFNGQTNELVNSSADETNDGSAIESMVTEHEGSQVVKDFTIIEGDFSPERLKANSDWETTYSQLKLQLPKGVIDNYLSRATLRDWSDGLFTLQVPDIYAQGWLNGRLKTPIERTLSFIAQYDAQVEFVVAGD